LGKKKFLFHKNTFSLIFDAVKNLIKLNKQARKFLKM
jgi:hypothetical protein